MAKKAISKLKTGTGRSFTRCIKVEKSEKTGAYVFTTGMVHVDQVEEHFKK